MGTGKPSVRNWPLASHLIGTESRSADVMMYLPMKGMRAWNEMAVKLGHSRQLTHTHTHTHRSRERERERETETEKQRERERERTKEIFLHLE